MMQKPSYEELAAQHEELRIRLLEAEETLQAIRNHEVDAIVSDGSLGHQVQIYTLQGAEQPYRVLVETMNEGALTMMRDGTILYCNNRFAELLQIPLNTIIGASLYDFFVSEDHEEAFETMIDTCAKDGCRGEFYLASPDGKEIPTSLSARSLTTDDLEAFCVVATDLTDQKRVQRELEEARNRLEGKVAERTALLSQVNSQLRTEIAERERIEAALQRLNEELESRVQERTEQLGRSEETARRALAEIESYYHTAPVGLVIFDADLRYVRINEHLAKLNGVPAADHIGRTPREIVPWLAGEIEGVVRRVLESGEPVKNIEFTGEAPGRPGAQGTWIEDWYPLKDAAGHVTGATAVVQEVTGQRRIEGELRQAQKMEAIGTLSGGIAHDFNNILASIVGFAELARDKTPPELPTRRHIERVLTAGLRGRELVKQILTFSRQAEQEKQPLRLGVIAQETVEFLRASLPSTISVSVNVQNEPGSIFADATQMQQVILNLCTNSAYAMKTGGRLTVRLSDFSFSSPADAPESTMGPGHYVRMEVTDTGEGIPRDVVQRIFDPFFTTKPQGEGTGLGLSVVHGIVASHGGAITVSSEPGKGSTFAVYFPCYQRDKPSVAREEADPTPGGCERILFVDDEEPLAEMGDEMLSGLGYKVVSQTSSREALTLLREDPHRFDLIMTDQTMPDMTGVDLAVQVLSVRPDIPVILCTGYSHMVDADAARAAGIRAFVMKPLTKGEIARTIRKVLDEQGQSW
jgi:PAS domain S-box-containing protein